MKNQFTVKTVIAGTTIFSIYFALAQAYGFGRAIVCLLVLSLGLSSTLFFAAAWHSLGEEHLRNALASLTLGVMILVGALFIAAIVFHPPRRPAVSLPNAELLDSATLPIPK